VEGKDKSNGPEDARKARRRRMGMRRPRADRRSLLDRLDFEFRRFQVLRMAGGVYFLGLVVILLVALYAMYDIAMRALSMPGSAWMEEKRMLTLGFFAIPLVAFLAGMLLRVWVETWVVLFRIAESTTSIERMLKSRPNSESSDSR
jgi:hypothetical protein